LVNQSASSAMLNNSSSGVVLKQFFTIIASAVLLVSCSFNNEWVDQSKDTKAGYTVSATQGWKTTNPLMMSR